MGHQLPARPIKICELLNEASLSDNAKSIGESRSSMHTNRMHNRRRAISSFSITHILSNQSDEEDLQVQNSHEDSSDHTQGSVLSQEEADSDEQKSLKQPFMYRDLETSSILLSLQQHPLSRSSSGQSESSASTYSNTVSPLDGTRVRAHSDPAIQLREVYQNNVDGENSKQKRMRQRMLVRRSYYRKINTLKELRAQEKLLRIEFERVIASRSQGLPKSIHDQYRENYTRLVMTKDQLRKENRALRLLASQRAKDRERMAILVEEEIGSNIPRSSTSLDVPMDMNRFYASEPGMDQPLYRRRVSLESLPWESPLRASYKLFAPSQCDELMADVETVITTMYRSQLSTNTLSDMDMEFGWTERRWFDTDHNGYERIHYVLEKPIFEKRINDIADQFHHVLTTTKGINSCYSSSIAVYSTLLQKVSEVHSIFHRSILQKGNSTMIQTLLLISKFKLDNQKTLIVFKSLDPKAYDLPMEADCCPNALWDELPQQFVWADMFGFYLLEPVDDKDISLGVRIISGGCMPVIHTESKEFWMKEVLWNVIRCEREALGSQILTQ